MQRDGGLRQGAAGQRKAEYRQSTQQRANRVSHFNPPWGRESDLSAPCREWSAAALWSGGRTNCFASSGNCQRESLAALHHSPGAPKDAVDARVRCEAAARGVSASGMPAGAVSALTGAFTSCVTCLPSLSDERQRHRDGLAFLERLLQVHQHHVVAARLQVDRLAGGQRELRRPRASSSRRRPSPFRGSRRCRRPATTPTRARRRIALLRLMNAPVAFWPGTVPRTHASETVTCASEGAAINARTSPRNESLDDMAIPSCGCADATLLVARDAVGARPWTAARRSVRVSARAADRAGTRPHGRPPQAARSRRRAAGAASGDSERRDERRTRRRGGAARATAAHVARRGTPALRRRGGRFRALAGRAEIAAAPVRAERAGVDVRRQHDAREHREQGQPGGEAALHRAHSTRGGAGRRRVVQGRAAACMG